MDIITEDFLIYRSKLKAVFAGYVLMAIHLSISGFSIPFEAVGAFIIMGSLHIFKQHKYFTFARIIALILTGCIFTSYFFKESPMFSIVFHYLYFILLTLLTFFILFGLYNICLEKGLDTHANKISKMWYYQLSLLIIQMFISFLAIYEINKRVLPYLSIVCLFYFLVMLNRTLFLTMNALEDHLIPTTISKANKNLVLTAGLLLVFFISAGSFLGYNLHQVNSKYLYNQFTFPYPITQKIKMTYSDLPNTAGIKCKVDFNEFEDKSHNTIQNNKVKTLELHLKNESQKENAIRDFVTLTKDIIQAMPKNRGMVGGLEAHDDFSKQVKKGDYIKGVIAISNDDYESRLLIRFSNVHKAVEINGEDMELHNKEAVQLNTLLIKYFDNWDTKGFITYKQK